ncbi:NAD(P)H-quinone oxidoreductase subunit H, chloroplastic [Ananas comosus]|uniref:NAD(P)H dehydrogenase subunit H n=1 Tax=Ananas comosus TaxID=4615 RepID=A0A199VFQ9_ANACO|nr:NAD(P)H-quinone oxidoreductase subunit H, chloroplastic [Ananas comosus]
MLRASGIQWDLRKVDHYECYNEFDWEVQWQKEGDSLARYLVRIGEMKESIKIIQQALEGIPGGPYENLEVRRFDRAKNSEWNDFEYRFIKLLLTTYAFCYHFQLDDPLMQLKEDSKWIDVFDFHWRLGIDGLSIGPILLTGFITTLATLAAWPVTRNSRVSIREALTSLNRICVMRAQGDIHDLLCESKHLRSRLRPVHLHISCAQVVIYIAHPKVLWPKALLHPLSSTF